MLLVRPGKVSLSTFTSVRRPFNSLFLCLDLKAIMKLFVSDQVINFEFFKFSHLQQQKVNVDKDCLVENSTRDGSDFIAPLILRPRAEDKSISTAQILVHL